MKKITAAKIILTVLFFSILFYRIKIYEIVAVFESLDLFFLVCAMATVPILYVIRTFRWKFFLSACGIPLPFSQIFRILLIGNFYGLITPGKIGEFGRAFHIEERKAVTVPTIIMEKITDIIILSLMSLIAIAFFFEASDFLIILVTTIVLGIAGMLLFFTNERLLILLSNPLGILPEDTETFILTLKRLLSDYPLVLQSLLFTILYYGVAFISAFFIAISAKLSPTVIIAMPITVLIGNFPLTISGLGLRESVGSLVFVMMGESAPLGFVFSFLLFLFITVIPSIFGYIFTIRSS